MAKTTGLASVTEGRGDIFKIDPRKIKIKPNWNARDFTDPDNIEAVNVIARSVAEIGFKSNKPITVKWEDSEVWLVNGETRLRGVMQAIANGVDVKTVPCVAADRYANEADQVFDQCLDNAGRPFKDLELARNFKRLLDLGWQQEDIAKRAGKTQGWVSQTLALLTAPVAVQKMIVAKEVSPTVAMQVVREQGAKAEQVLKNGLKAAKAEGGTKVQASHVGKMSISKAIKDAIEFSDIDDSAEDIVVIKMPAEKWEVIRELLKL